MPEYPDVTLYVEALVSHVAGQRLERARVKSPYLLRSVEPALSAVEGRRVLGARSLGKRVVLDLEDDLHLVFHLMVTGRLRWRDRGVAVPKKYGHAAFDFETGALLLTEMGSKKRASLHVVRGDDALLALDPGGLDLFAIDLAAFAEALSDGNHTLKRALTNPHRLSGIGNAYSDEILHHAGLSPLQLTQNLSDAELARLFESTKTVLTAWTDKLRTALDGAFPEKVTAFRDGMAVHGRYREPCPKCEAPVQRIVYADNEVNYCARCQTGGKVLADRALSRLLKRDWPRSLDEWEEMRSK
ncbi:MAG: DNA-formamidopyrimidine glycosylase family protein [Planctomycetota bacterium]